MTQIAWALIIRTQRATSYFSIGVSDGIRNARKTEIKKKAFFFSLSSAKEINPLSDHPQHFLCVTDDWGRITELLLLLHFLLYFHFSFSPSSCDVDT